MVTGYNDVLNRLESSLDFDEKRKKLHVGKQYNKYTKIIGDEFSVRKNSRNRLHDLNDERRLGDRRYDRVNLRSQIVYILHNYLPQ